MTRRRNQTRRGASSRGIDSTRLTRVLRTGFTLLGYVASLVALFYLISFVAFAVAS